MYHLLLVEDEEIEREYLRRFVNWEKMNIEVTAAFESAEEALTFAERNRVDILLTDIKLLGISGLALAKKLLSIKPEVKVVILSGYQQFEYAREAVDIRAMSFLTKPVDMSELESVFTKVVDQCVREENEKLEKARLQEIVERNMPVLKNKFYEDLLHGRLTASETERYGSSFGLTKTDGIYNVLVSEIDAFATLTEKMEPSEIHLLQISVLEIMKTVYMPPGSVNLSIRDGRFGTLVVLDGAEAENAYKKGLELAQDIQGKVNQKLNLEMTVGIGKEARNLPDIKISYQKACDAVAFKFYMGSNQIIHYKDIYYDENSGGINLEEAGRQTATAVGLCDREKLEALLIKLFDDMRAKSGTDNYIRNSCVYLLSRVSASLQEIHESFGKVFGDESLVWQKILKIDTAFDLQLWLTNIFNAVIDYLAEKKAGSNKRIIASILRYVEENYHRNIGISDIAAQVYLSPNYISVIFKKETGEAFSNYLIRYRMEKASAMLKETNLKVYEIGDRVGYTNTSHFCTAFKKMYGVSPNDYRERI